MELRNLRCNPQRQQGVVLITSLVFLIALTGVAGALMLNTTSDMRMAGAGQEKFIATQETISAVDEIIAAQVTAASGDNNFALPLVLYAAPIPVKGALIQTANNVNKAEISIANNPFMLEPDCPHSRNPSSTGVFTCNVLKVTVDKSYGRKGKSNIEANSGIAQQLLR